MTILGKVRSQWESSLIGSHIILAKCWAGKNGKLWAEVDYRYI